jgi:hypothetical protein
MTPGALTQERNQSVIHRATADLVPPAQMTARCRVRACCSWGTGEIISALKAMPGSRLIRLLRLNAETVEAPARSPDVVGRAHESLYTWVRICAA